MSMAEKRKEKKKVNNDYKRKGNDINALSIKKKKKVSLPCLFS